MYYPAYKMANFKFGFKRSKTHFLAFSFNFHFTAHATIRLRSSCNKACEAKSKTGQYILTSSAYIFIFAWKRISGKSLVNKTNSKGPKTKPWGTPLRHGNQSEHTPLILTCCFLSVKKFLIQVIENTSTPYAQSLVISSEWDIQSKALEKSK